MHAAGKQAKARAKSGGAEWTASPAASPQHFEEIGHAEEAAVANALGFINLHFL